MKLLRVSVPNSWANALSDHLLSIGAQAVDTSTEGAERGWVWVTAYVEEASARAVRGRGQTHLDAAARRAGTSPAPRLVSQAVRADWQTSWTQTLAPAKLVTGLVLVADGVAYEAAPGERVLRLEPGLFFGFGEHPTTQLIGEWLGRYAAGKSVLDVGCGTGVLAFVAAHVGAREVFGIDIDVPSVASARRNAFSNGWEGVCTFASDALQSVQAQFEVVVANIEGLTLGELAAELVRVLAQRGCMALTGLLVEQADDVRAAFAESGLRLEVVGERDGWVLLANTPS